MNLINIPISNEQRGMIFGLAKDLNIDNDALHDYMFVWAKVSSLKADSCSKASANIIIECLQKMSGTAKEENKPRKPGDATPKQLAAISSIAADKGWNASQLSGFIKHTVGKTDPEDLKMNEASQVITGLKKLSKTLIKSR